MQNLTADARGPIKEGKDSRRGPRERMGQGEGGNKSLVHKLGAEMRTETYNLVLFPNGVL